MKMYAIAFAVLAVLCASCSVKAPSLLPKIDRQALVEEAPSYPATPDSSPTERPEPNEELYRSVKGITGPLVWVSAVVGLGLFVTSYFVPWMPRRASGAAFAVAMGALFVQHWANAYGGFVAHAAFWAVLVTCVTCAIPLAVGLVRRSILSVGKKLEREGDCRAAVAVMGLADRTLKTRRQRKARLRTLEAKGT